MLQIGQNEIFLLKAQFCCHLLQINLLKSKKKNLDHIEEAAAKQFLAKQEVVKDLTSEISYPPKDSSDDPKTWESSEIPYCNKLGRWTTTRGSCFFDIEACHR